MYEAHNLKKLPTLGSKASEAWQGYLAFNKAALADGDDRRCRNPRPLLLLQPNGRWLDIRASFVPAELKRCTRNGLASLILMEV